MKHFTLPKDGGLITTNLPKGILHSHERITTEIFDDATAGSEAIGNIVIKAINEHVANNPGRNFKLGLSTGASPVSLFTFLAEKHRQGVVSFKNVEVFSIDEYYPCEKDSLQNRNHRLNEIFLNMVDVKPENVHIPDGTVPREVVSEYCAEFDKMARGLEQPDTHGSPII